MSRQLRYCGSEQRDRLGDDGRPVSLHVSAKGFSLASVSDDQDRLIATADLRYAELLAAAPELLAALKAIVNDAREVLEGREQFDLGLFHAIVNGKARAAIAKAEGR